MTDTHIKINAVTPRVQYTGNGSTTTFPYTFAIFDEDNMEVYVNDTLQESGYTVTGVGEDNGGNVVFDTAPTDGDVVTLYRNVPIERVTDFQEGGAFRPKNINDEFDRQTAFCQQIQEGINRCLQLDVTSQITPSLILPQVERIYDSIDNIDAVADNETNINSVAGDLTNIDSVISNLTNINAVAGNATNINAVNSNKTNIDAVAGNSTNINAVAGNASNINTVAGMSSDITTVAGISSNVTSVASNSTNINAVAGNATNINAVNANKTNIDAVAGNATNINAVNSNKTNIDTCATNMSSITAAQENAQKASVWAEGTDVQVQALGGTHSAKKWAEISQSLPSQTGNNGKFLTTDGSNASWVTVNASTVGALASTTTANDINGANKDLSNISSTGQNAVKTIIDNRIQLVNSLPASPDANTWYGIPE